MDREQQHLQFTVTSSAALNAPVSSVFVFPAACWWELDTDDLRGASLFSDVFGTTSRIHPPTPPQAPPSRSNCHRHLTGEEKPTALWIRRADSVLATPFPDSTHNNLNAIRHECVWCGLSALKMHNDKLKRVECCTKCRVKLPLLSSLHRCCCHFCLLKRQKDFSPYAFYVFFTSDCKVVIFLLKRMSKKNENVNFFPQSYWNEFWRWINYTEIILSAGSAPITTYSSTSQTTISAKWAPIECPETCSLTLSGSYFFSTKRIASQWGNFKWE